MPRTFPWPHDHHEKFNESKGVRYVEDGSKTVFLILIFLCSNLAIFRSACCGRAQDVVAELGKNGLPKEQYPYVKLPVSLVGEASVTGQPASAVPLKKPHSVRTIRYNWAAAGKISVGSASRYTCFSNTVGKILSSPTLHQRR